MATCDAFQRSQRDLTELPPLPLFHPFSHTHIESWEKGYKAGRAEAKMNRNLL